MTTVDISARAQPEGPLMTTTTMTEAVIPAAEHATGFVAVAIRFPDPAAAHRAEYILHRPDATTDDADRDVPVRLTETLTGWTETRPACEPDSNPSERFYALSIPSALARGARPCGQPQCFGGAA